MRILLGSTNPSKRESVEAGLKKLGVLDYEIIPFKVESGVSSKPMDADIISGAHNRNQQLKKIANESNIEYDYLCSIEGGFLLININESQKGLPFIVTFCIFEDKNGKESTGMSLGFRISRELYDYVKEGNSLNSLIEEINGSKNNKQNGGITGYLSNGLLDRQDVDTEAVVDSLNFFINPELNEKLKQAIKKRNK